MSPTRATPSSSPARARSSMLSCRRSNRASFSKRFAQARRASGAANAYSGFSCRRSGASDAHARLLSDATETVTLDHRGQGTEMMKVYYDKDADLSLIKGKKVTIV